MRVARSLSCVWCNCVSVTLKSDTSSHSTAKTHLSSITVSFSIPHHVLLLMGDTVIFANVCPPENLPLSKSLGVQPQTLPPNVTPGFCFKTKTGKKNCAAHKNKINWEEYEPTGNQCFIGFIGCVGPSSPPFLARCWLGSPGGGLGKPLLGFHIFACLGNGGSRSI